MVILLRYTSAFSEVIYTDFYAKICDWNLNFSFSFRFVDENYRILVVVVVFVTKINLFSSTKIFVFVVFDEKKHWFVHVAYSVVCINMMDPAKICVCGIWIFRFKSIGIGCGYDMQWQLV